MAATKYLQGACRAYTDASVEEIVKVLDSDQIPRNAVIGFTYDPDAGVYAVLIKQ